MHYSEDLEDTYTAEYSMAGIFKKSLVIAPDFTISPFGVYHIYKMGVE
jgi:hypothetical protein